MNKNGLFSMEESVLLGVDVSAKYDIIDLIRAKKAATGELNDLSYDFDDDGVVSNGDIETLKKIILGV